MFEKFTERARKVMSLARQEAQRSNTEFIGSEHILLAIMNEGGGVAAKVLTKFRVDTKSVRTEVEKMVTPSTTPIMTLGQLPFSPRAKRVIELAGEASSRLQVDWIGTGQLLIGLIQEFEGIAAQVMTKLGIDLVRLEQTVSEFDKQSVTASGITGDTPGTALKNEKMVIKLYSKIASKFHDRHVLVVNGETYLESGEISVNGIDVAKRGEVAQAIAKEHGSAVYVVETTAQKTPLPQPPND
jgi:ATP-dependent Clp protease ATP-binding subunit ClpA